MVRVILLSFCSIFVSNLYAVRGSGLRGVLSPVAERPMATKKGRPNSKKNTSDKSAPKISFENDRAQRKAELAAWEIKLGSVMARMKGYSPLCACDLRYFCVHGCCKHGNKGTLPCSLDNYPTNNDDDASQASRADDDDGALSSPLAQLQGSILQIPTPKE